MTIMTDIRTPAPVDARTLFAQRRAAIDIISNARAKSIATTLFGTYLCLSQQPSDAKRQEWIGLLKQSFDDIDRISHLVRGSDPLDEVPAEVATWIGEYGATKPAQVAAFDRTRDLTRTIWKAAESQGIPDLERAIEAHKEFGRQGFSDIVSGFCNGLWADLDEERHAATEKAKATADTIAKTLQRLAHIGKHVRLVSLNASVEAARVGDAGRGLGVIAVEFKTLAEEIQRLAVTASEEMAGGTAKPSASP